MTTLVESFKEMMDKTKRLTNAFSVLAKALTKIAEEEAGEWTQGEAREALAEAREIMEGEQ